jgi:hypothetical protein
LTSQRADWWLNEADEGVAELEPVNGIEKVMGSEVCGGKDRSDGSDDRRDSLWYLVSSPIYVQAILSP